MVLYDFVCSKCERHFEAILDGSDDEDPKCPECGGKLIRQMPTPFIKYN